MRALSKGLEIRIELTKHQLKDLSLKNELHGLLHFFELENKFIREIPFKLKLSTDHRDHMFVEHNPNDAYFGHAKDFSITIYLNHYKKLFLKRYCKSKFYREGKISIYKTNI
jgi:hypothetical protein